ncbi:MAG: hypothetical protein ACD_7C00415G0002 [uncultured bacterium]|nr:MAG: hypothetical protein ACD_7C00415G0002 [uncultured bacterium]
MKGLKKFLVLMGRLMVSAIFILSALNKIFEWQKTQTALINLFCDWQSYVGSFLSISKFFAKLITWAPEILIVFTVIELIAALLIFFGIKEKLGAFLLILIFIPATLVLHPFWFLSGVKKSIEMVVFLKNLAILGGLFFLMIFGSKINDSVSLPPIMTKPKEFDAN